MSREDVIRRIMDRDRRNLGLAEGVVRREDTVLYASACECFATWDTALRYAGVSKQRVTRQREAGAETVKRQILDLCQNANILEAKRIRLRQPAIYRAAVKQFGSWDQALQAVGVAPENVFRYTKDQRPTEAEIVKTLISRHENGRSLRRTDVIREDYAFCMAAIATFGSWTNALKEAGVLEPSLSARRVKWSEEEILAEIRRLYDPENPSRLSPRRRSALESAARRRFGKWSEALRAAGIPAPRQKGPTRQRKPKGKKTAWSRERIIAMIQARSTQGLPLRGLRRLAPRLYDAVLRYFGDLDSALAAAGVASDQVSPEGARSPEWTGQEQPPSPELDSAPKEDP